MGDKDSVTKEYMKQPERFADLFNGFCYGGEQRIQPGDLRDMDTASIVLPYGSAGAALPEQKARDVLKLALKTDGSPDHKRLCWPEFQPSRGRGED